MRLTIVNKGYVLAYWRVIVYLNYCADEVVIKVLHSNDYATFLRSSHVLATFLGKSLPPVLEAGDVKGGNAVPFDGVWVLGVCCGQFLGEGEDVGSQSVSFAPF